MSTKGSRWGRTLTEEQAANFADFLDGFGLKEQDLAVPDEGVKQISIRVSTEFAVWLKDLATDYGMRSNAEIARAVLLGWAKTADHPRRSRRPKPLFR